MSTESLTKFIADNKLSDIMGNVNIGNEYLYSYAKTKKNIILKYHSKFNNFSLQVEGLYKDDGTPKSIIDTSKDGVPNKLFLEIISRLQKATPVEKSVSTMVDELDLF